MKKKLLALLTEFDRVEINKYRDEGPSWWVVGVAGGPNGAVFYGAETIKEAVGKAYADKFL